MGSTAIFPVLQNYLYNEYSLATNNLLAANTFNDAYLLAATNNFWTTNTVLATMWRDRLPDPSGNLPSEPDPEQDWDLDSFIEWQIYWTHWLNFWDLYVFIFLPQREFPFQWLNWAFDLLLVNCLHFQKVQRNYLGKSVTLRWARAPTTTRMWKIWWDFFKKVSNWPTWWNFFYFIGQPDETDPTGRIGRAKASPAPCSVSYSRF